MTPTDTLKHEHEIVLLVLRGVERAAKELQCPGDAVLATFEKAVDFFRNFVDRCHHTKEEKHLFLKMEERGLPPNAGPLAVMVYEHEEGRRLVRELAAAIEKARAGDAAAIAAIKQGVQAYADLLRAHIDKEDNVLYPMAEQMLTLQDQQDLAKAFDKIESEEMGEGVHEKYHQFAHEINK